MLKNDCTAYKILKSCGVDEELYERYFERSIDTNSNIEGYTPRMKFILKRAGEIADDTDGAGAFVGTEHLLVAILANEECLAMRILKAMGADIKKIAATLEKVLQIRE
ncbi:MAG: Clp protease N-terminal domain-containing protein [Clostridia bacterium]|nr:Clp protease N-terminal domain-containing protein [Clostridia bacterium]